MCTLSKSLTTLLTYSRLPSSLKTLKLATFKRNVQSFTQNLSTVPAVKIEQSIESRICKDDFDFTKFGTFRPKIEVDGMMLNWDVVGHGEHVVLLLPGTLGTMQADFGPIFQKMNKNKYTLVSWDPPGYGKSRPPSRDFSGVHYRTDANIVIKLMDKLGFDKFSMMGWSGGASTGFFVAGDHPSRVNRFVTISGMAFSDQRIVDLVKNLVDLDKWNPKMLKPMLEIYGKEYLVELVRNWYTSLCEMHYDNTHAPIKESVFKVKCPTLIVHGGQDLVAGMEHAEYLKNIPNSRMHIIPKGAHNLHLRYTDEFLKVATQFLES